MIPHNFIKFIIAYEDQTTSQTFNPLRQIITPEWLYSESFQILKSIDIEWTNLTDLENIFVGSNFNINSDFIRYSNGFENKFSTWYQPYHFSPRSKWGIHIRYGNVLGITEMLKLECPNLKNKSIDALRSAFLYLYTHSSFHFLIENLISEYEIMTNKHNIYNKYYESNHLNYFKSNNCIEELLATLYLFKNYESCKIDKKCLYKILKNQDSTYQNFEKLDHKIIKSLSKLLHSDVCSYNIPTILLSDFNDLENLHNTLRFSNQYELPI
ncbi:MAG: hypothetical protein ACPKPY_05715 [Nitrososphaeraceae archaeon]